jgi:hypothetical protein
VALVDVSDQLQCLAAFPPSTDFIGGWVGPRVGLDIVANRNDSAPSGNQTPVIQPEVSYFTD